MSKELRLTDKTTEDYFIYAKITVAWMINQQKSFDCIYKSDDFRLSKYVKWSKATSRAENHIESRQIIEDCSVDKNDTVLKQIQ